MKFLDEFIDGKRSCSKWNPFREQLLHQSLEVDNDEVCENLRFRILEHLPQLLSETKLSIEKIDREMMERTRKQISKVLDDDKRSLKELGPLFTKNKVIFNARDVSDILLLNPENEGIKKQPWKVQKSSESST